jgi:hypothetical protein
MSGHIGTINPTDKERVLLEQIDFDPPSHDHEVYLANSKRVVSSRGSKSIGSKQLSPQIG